MSKGVEDWTIYDAHGRVVSKNRDSRLSQALLKEAEKEANRVFKKLVKKGVYKEDEFEKFCIEYYLEEKNHE